MNAVLQTENLTMRFRRVAAVDGLNLEVPPGAIFALTGANGAGKTTTIQCAMNILRPTAGRCRVLGTESTRLGPRELASIGYVSENRQLPGGMTVGRFLAFCRPMYPSWDDTEAQALVRQYDLPVDRPLSGLSRGMRVKAMLAAALAHRPRLIVLDEPFGGLDVLVREQLIESILERTPDAAVLLASHDLAEIESFATHVAYLNQGRLLFSEETSALTARFQEVEVTLDEPRSMPLDLPKTWLRPQDSGKLIRFVDSSWHVEASPDLIRGRFPAAQDVTHQGMSLRSILLAMASTAPTEQISR